MNIIEDIRTCFVAYAATDLLSIKTTDKVVDTSLSACIWMGKFVLSIQEDEEVMNEIRSLMMDDPYLYSRMVDFFGYVRRFARGPVTLKAERLLECQPSIGFANTHIFYL